MAESKTKNSQSQIPVKASSSRYAQSAMPNTLSSPHFSFAPSSQHLSVSDSPSHQSQNTVPTPANSSGITTFRSFRNLLPFGPTKLPSTSNNPAPSSKSSPFSNLGVIRRSMNGERSVSAPVLRPKKSQEDPPILSIQLSHKVDEPLIKPEDLRGGLGLYMKQPEPPPPPPPQSAPATSQRFQPVVTSPPSPQPVGVSDLSTIMESETSGISRYTPNFDDSQERQRNNNAQQENGRIHPPDAVDIKSRHSSTEQFLIPPPASHERLPTPELQDTSALDLSTSKVNSEVLEALANDRPQAWLHGIVIDDTDTPTTGGGENPDASFNFDALDPELEALLSPNRIKSPDGGLLRAVDSLALPLTTPPMTESRLASPTASPFTPLPSDDPCRSRTQSIRTNTSPVLTARSVTSQSSPIRRPATLARSTSASAVVPPIPDPTRLPVTQSKTLLPSPSIHPSLERTSDTGERPPSAGLAASRRRGYSQLAGEGDNPRRPTTGGDAEPRRPVLSRLMTPIRPALQLTPGSGRSRNAGNKVSPSAWDGDTISLSRPPSSMGRPSLDSSADRFRSSTNIRSRDRSASVTERPATFYGTSGRPPATEWLGPRTAKAFAAAGLIDVDKDNSQAGPSRPGSRFSSSRSTTNERDSRSQYAPSRMAFSETGSGSSWGRRSGSISRTGAMSEVNGPLSESASTPRTTFSTGSTALTSVSSGSVQQHLQSELQAIQDKHALETGALLNALADSQRTSKMLRDENTELRERLHELEGRLADAVSEIQRLQYQASLPQNTSYSRGAFQRSSGLRSSETLSIRKRPSALQTVLNANVDDDVDEDKTDIHLHALSSHAPSARSSSESRREDLYVPHPKRFSNSSSIFPIPPSTMSMLLHEEGLAPEAYSTHSRSPPSPTVTLSKLSSRGSFYGHHRSASTNTAMTTGTTGNISPTTANFSILTGSPGSLNLRPEHEMLLGDMPPLNLSADDYELDVDGS